MGWAVPALAGAVIGGLSSKKQASSTQVQKADPWGPVQPYLQGLYRDAWNSGTPQYYPGSTVANMSGNTTGGISSIRSKAMTPDATMGDANSLAQRTMRGDYLMSNPAMSNLQRTAGGEFLNANPYLDSMFDQAASRVGDTFRKYTTPGIDSSFALGGRYGSNAHQTAMGTAQQNFGDSINRLATDIYGGNYARERGLMEGAAGTMGQLYGQERGFQSNMANLAPELQRAGYLPAEMQLRAGSIQDAFNQRKVDDDVKRWDHNENMERERLAFINQILNGASAYGTKSTSGSQGTNPILGMLGGGLMGSQLGSLFSGGGVFPMGTGY